MGLTSYLGKMIPMSSEISNFSLSLSTTCFTSTSYSSSHSHSKFGLSSGMPSPTTDPKVPIEMMGWQKGGESN